MMAVLVGFKINAKNRRKWARLCTFWGSNDPIILDNAAPENNQYFEFSGYLKALEMLISRDHFPALLVNDTIFRHHWTSAWKLLIYRLFHISTTTYNPKYIYGDLRYEKCTFNNLPLIYNASWFFFLPSIQSAKSLQHALQFAITEWGVKPKDGTYIQFIEAYYKPNLSSGYTNLLSIEDKKRKINCSLAEHRSGQWLHSIGQLASLSELVPVYLLIHQVDRVFSAFYRAYLFNK